MNKRLKVLLTGASGAIGLEVLKQLFYAKIYDITVFDVKTSHSEKAFSSFSDTIKIIYGDIRLEQEVEKACFDQDIVIHLAAVIPPVADEQPEFAYKVNVVGTENLIRSLERNSPNAILFYSSSISIYGDRVLNPYIYMTDSLEPSEGDEYAKTKIIAEKLIQTSKLNWTIFRLCAIMGNHKISKLMFHQPLNTSFELATLADTARAFVNGIEKRDELSGRIFNLGGGENCRCTYEEFLDRSFEIAGLGKLNFASKSFADKNFHCGFYADGSDLEDIVHFRKDTLKSYFEGEEKKVSFVKRLATSIFKVPIKYYLQKKSEPLQAFRLDDKKAITHYFTDGDSE